MARISTLCLTACLLVPAACTPVFPGPITGGPCSYETSTVTATVIEVDEDGALFSGDGEEFWVPGEYLGPLPAAGDTLTLQRERITEGTCTPEIYSILDVTVD